MRVLGIDFGDKRIGVAFCDTDTPVAVPKKTIEGSTGIVLDVASLIRDENIEHVVLGLPLKMDGEEGEMVVRVRAFGAELEEKTSVPVEYIDERLSSARVHKGGATDVDAAAAAEILQTWLDRDRA